MSKRKQPNLSQFGFTKQTKRSDDSAPATTSLPVIPPPPLKVAASDSTSTEDSETLAPETTAATCSGPGDHATPFNILGYRTESKDRRPQASVVTSDLR